MKANKKAMERTENEEENCGNYFDVIAQSGTKT